MDTFSMRGAWSFGYRFFAHRALLHILVLVGIGIAVPVLLQFATFGQVVGTPNPAMLGSQSTQLGSSGILPPIVMLGVYFLQIASYFTSWRLGFSVGRPVGGAFLFGLLAALLTVGVFALVCGPAIWAGRAAASAEIPFMGLLITLIPTMIVAAVFYTLVAALIATIVSILLVATMLLGAVTGNVGMAATIMGGGSGAVVVLFLVLSVILMWLASRLSCTTSVMADWKTCNLLAAIRESWRLTLEDQWAILRYLALIAFALGVVIIGVSALAGFGAAAFLGEGAGPRGQLAGLALGHGLAIPLAFLAVLVPAGIYRELTRSSMDADIFA